MTEPARVLTVGQSIELTVECLLETLTGRLSSAVADTLAARKLVVIIDASGGSRGWSKDRFLLLRVRAAVREFEAVVAELPGDEVDAGICERVTLMMQMLDGLARLQDSSQDA